MCRATTWAAAFGLPAVGGHTITALENIPLLSWLWLRGRCSACRAPIGARYPLVELLTALLSAAVAWKWGASVQTAGALLMMWALITLAFIDLDTALLPDSLTLPLLCWGCCSIWAGISAACRMRSSAHGRRSGAVAGVLAVQARHRQGRDGYGDFKLLAAIGAWLGWQMLPVHVVAVFRRRAVVGIAMIVLVKHDRRVPIPFGPYLAGAGGGAFLRRGLDAGLPRAIMMFTVGLTGGIGSGKSTVADCFAVHGVPVIDTDVIARDLTAPGGAAGGDPRGFRRKR